MDSGSYGFFTFAYLNSPSDAPPVKAWADFRYWDREWHLNQFDYGCNHVLLKRNLSKSALGNCRGCVFCSIQTIGSPEQEWVHILV
jgi:hypothetical protein